MNVEGPTCSSCKPGNFHLSSANKDGCLSCFCMGVTQQCFSSAHYRDLVGGGAREPGTSERRSSSPRGSSSQRNPAKLLEV